MKKSILYSERLTVLGLIAILISGFFIILCYRLFEGKIKENSQSPSEESSSPENYNMPAVNIAIIIIAFGLFTAIYFIVKNIS